VLCVGTHRRFLGQVDATVMTFDGELHSVQYSSDNVLPDFSSGDQLQVRGPTRQDRLACWQARQAGRHGRQGRLAGKEGWQGRLAGRQARQDGRQGWLARLAGKAWQGRQ
jgi:hypothetical protein